MFKIKVIFLDIDGVMNSYASIVENYQRGINRPDERFSKSSINALEKIIKETNAKIVISSTWGLSNKTIRAFKYSNFDLDTIIGETSALKNTGHRGKEINAYIDNTDEIESFVIIDDDNDMGSLMDNLYQVDNQIGLLEKDADKIIKMLN